MFNVACPIRGHVEINFSIIKKCKGFSYKEILRKLGIRTLEYRRHRADLIQVYRLFSGIDKIDDNVFISLHNEDEAGSVRAETRGHPRKFPRIDMLED